MDHLREGIGLQGYGQKDPLIEYKKQGFKFFEMMMGMIQADVVRKIFAVQLAQPGQSAPGLPRATAPAAQQIERAFEKEFENSGQSMQYNLNADGELVPVQAATGASSGPQAQAQAQPAPQPFRMPTPQRSAPMTLSRGNLPTGATPMGGPSVGVSSNDVEKVGRNDVCPCGSGKKYKKCHGA
jgi:preprotein translocase subunit SecA